MTKDPEMTEAPREPEDTDMQEEPEIIMSPLCRTVEMDGHSVRVEIYSSGKNDWVLEVVDIWGTSTVWDDVFETDAQALEEFDRALAEDGITSMSGPVS